MNLSIIITLFNVEAYISDLSASLNENHLPDDVEVIIINDGSTDRSSMLTNMLDNTNVIYIETVNQGVHSARNLGLKKALGKWITFIDGDDFISNDYFENIDYESCCDVINNRMKLYIEETDKVISHPLDYKFNNNRIIDINHEYYYFNLSVANLVFRRDIIIENNLFFKPVVVSFEDALFYVDYIKCCSGEVLINNKSVYYYRKRKTNDSTIDQSQLNGVKYTGFLNDVYINLLESDNSEYIQAVVLYDMWNNMLSYRNYEVDLGNSRGSLISIIVDYISIDVIKNMKKYLDVNYIDYITYLKTKKHFFKIYNIKRGRYKVITTNKLFNCDDYNIDNEELIFDEYEKLYLYDLSTKKVVLKICGYKFYLKSLKNKILFR